MDRRVIRKVVENPAPVLKGRLSSVLSFRQRYAYLAWSNPEADDRIYIRQALLTAQFDILLEAANEYGVEALEREWKVLRSAEKHRPLELKDRIESTLANISTGFRRAEARYHALKNCKKKCRYPSRLCTCRPRYVGY